ncbi:MAG: DUF72 domain-containing protein [Thermodesulfobacteriota bacterium]
MQLHVGTSGYGYKEWQGIFYPARTPAKEMLRFYATRLGAVEINYTFYHMPTERVLLSWAAQVPDGFASEAELAHWLERIRAQGWQEAFVFFKHEAAGQGPELALRFQSLAGEAPSVV